ncbi:MAG: tRNA (adenosine(37)-N6)-dimethylallyltransferase MiaA [Eubacteriales bacterium]|nr:tRNA (adenosine(37)-N6)-dimethylallyltransferase MiaA [Eubacteriales bacterium]
MALLREEPVVVITGPTASGKSDLAIEVAKALDGEVISADSMQIYRDLDIATAKVLKAERQGIPHHLYDIRDPGESYSVAQFVADATQLILEILDRGKLPIVCGGTGLYVNSLVDGLQFVAAVPDPEERKALSDAIAKKGLAESHAKLASLDPKAALRIKPQDHKRITRFFEVYQATGMTSSEVYEYSRAKGPDFNYLAFVLWPDRGQLYDRINRRTARMFDAGIVDELTAVLKDYPNFSDTQAFQAIGYKEVLPYLEGIVSREEAIAALAQASRRYAKRQYTMFRSRPDFIHLTGTTREDNLAIVLRYITDFLQK